MYILKSEYYSNMLFPGKLYCFKSSRKLIHSMLYQHSNIIESGVVGGGGGGWRVEVNNLEKV